MDAERVTEEFFKRRFPKKDIEFEKKCGYFGEWIERFKGGTPEMHMDSISLKVWKEMQEVELTPAQEDHMIEAGMEKIKELKTQKGGK